MSCTLLTRDTLSPECQKAAVQSLQLLALCDSYLHESLRSYLGSAALGVIMESHDAAMAVLSLTPEVLATLQPQIDGFLAKHRRGYQPDAMQVHARRTPPTRRTA